MMNNFLKSRTSRFGFIPLTFVLILLTTTILNFAGIMKGQPLVASDYSVSWIVGMLILAVVLEFLYLFIDKMLGGMFG